MADAGNIDERESSSSTHSSTAKAAYFKTKIGEI